MGIDNTPCYVDGDNEWDLDILVNAAQNIKAKHAFIYQLNFTNLYSDSLEENIKLVKEANLNDPVIVSPYRYVVVGMYTILRALLEGKTMVPVKALIQMPPPTRTVISREPVY